MSVSKKTSIKIQTDTLERLNKKRTIGVSVDSKGRESEKFVAHNDFQNFLIDALEVLEQTARGETKAALQLKKFLVFGHDRPVTPSELRLFCGVNLNTCKVVISRHEEEVNLFNSKFK